MIGFILLRNFISKRKNISDIFLERRAYKRRVKKYLSKDILAENLRDEMVHKLITSQNIEDPMNVFAKLISRDSSQST